jgi:ubiquinone/menaquinone biosynthesis C-methylase UbiE
MKNELKGYDRVARFYDFLKSGDSRRWKESQTNFFKNLKGKVLYVGIGTGQEIVNFPPNLNIYAIDISINMLKNANRRIQQYPGSIKPILMNVETLGFPDYTFDSIVTVCVFCTVKNPIEGFKELSRVLKPKGKIYSFEHVLSKNPIFSLILKNMNMLSTRLSGTRLDRVTASNINKAGLRIESETNIYQDIVKAFVSCS